MFQDELYSCIFNRESYTFLLIKMKEVCAGYNMIN